MFSSYDKLSAGRIQRILHDEYQYENPSDIIADIMHYCEQNKIPFEAVLNTAQGYYDADRKETLLEDDGA
jgi:hypothetical protein